MASLFASAKVVPLMIFQMSRTGGELFSQDIKKLRKIPSQNNRVIEDTCFREPPRGPRRFAPDVRVIASELCARGVAVS